MFKHWPSRITIFGVAISIIRPFASVDYRAAQIASAFASAIIIAPSED
jgi:hypothetical protein